MSAWKTATEDSEQLVREGGVLNLRQPPPFLEQDRPAKITLWTDPDPLLPDRPELVGTVRVITVHHADDCAEFEQNMQDPLGVVFHCHPNAEPDRWHWTVEPAGTS